MTDPKDVVADRDGRYGHPVENFTTIADLWTTILSRIMVSRGGQYADIEHPFMFEPEDVGLFMIAVKMAREAHVHDDDNTVDIAGYARCMEMVHE